MGQEENNFYYCVYCESWLEIKNGVIVHFDLSHPDDNF